MHFKGDQKKYGESVFLFLFSFYIIAYKYVLADCYTISCIKLHFCSKVWVSLFFQQGNITVTKKNQTILQEILESWKINVLVFKKM